jgi:hypothetical protein
MKCDAWVTHRNLSRLNQVKSLTSEFVKVTQFGGNFESCEILSRLPITVIVISSKS